MPQYLELVRTCCQIYAEAVTLYYRNNTFRLDTSYSFAGSVQLFADTLREGQRHALRYIEFSSLRLLYILQECNADNLDEPLFDRMLLTTMFPNLQAVKIGDDWCVSFLFRAMVLSAPLDVVSWYGF